MVGEGILIEGMGRCWRRSVFREESFLPNGTRGCDVDGGRTSGPDLGFSRWADKHARGWLREGKWAGALTVWELDSVMVAAILLRLLFLVYRFCTGSGSSWSMGRSGSNNVGKMGLLCIHCISFGIRFLIARASSNGQMGLPGARPCLQDSDYVQNKAVIDTADLFLCWASLRFARLTLQPHVGRIGAAVRHI